MIKTFTPLSNEGILKRFKSGLRALGFVVLFAFPGLASAQVSIACYQFSQTNRSYVPITGGTLIASGTVDDAVYTSAIGFTFAFNGTNYTNASISSNGYVCFGSTSSYLTNALINVPNIICALQRDLQGNGAGEMRVETTGSAPNRVCTFQWNNWAIYPSGSTGTNFSMQIKIYETTNKIEICYGSFSMSATTYVPQVGIAANSSQYQCRTVSTSWATSTAGSSNTATCNISSTCFPASGLVFSYSFATELTAGFFMPDTAFKGTQVKMTNANQLGFTHDWDINDDGSFEYLNTVNLVYTFNTAGTYNIRLKSYNCVLRDSIVKTIVIVNPTAPPTADFVAYSNNVAQYGLATLYDLSNNGPTSWDWLIFSPADSAGTAQTSTGSNPNTNQNPMFNLVTPGSYTVCLRAGNSLGTSSTVCKANYITVAAPSDINIGVQPPNVPANGVLYDNGGNANPYGNNRYDYITIAPCGATSVTLNFTTFKLGTGDNLQIYDGVNALGAPLHPSGGWTASNPLPKFTNIVCNSGAVYILFQTDGSSVDSGFRAVWTSVIGPLTPPNVSFTLPDTIYNAVPTTIYNTTTNAKGDVSYTWEIDGAMVGTSKDFPFVWLTDGTYELKLTVTTCSGTSSFADSVVVVTPHSKTKLDFFAFNRRPGVGDTVIFTSFYDKANTFRWTIYPNTVQVVAGGVTQDKMTLKFLQPGAYTITLRAWNNLDSPGTVRTLIKDDYVIVTKYCVPNASIISEDIGIKEVKLSKGTTDLISNTSTTGISAFTDYSKTIAPASLTFGATYSLSISRYTNLNNATRRVWIDFNIDGDFNDAGEMIVNESATTAMTYTGNFTVPKITSSFTGKTLMRVSIAYQNGLNNPCGSNASIPNPATYVGEIEDYAIILMNDGQPPILSLIGDDTMSIEVGTTFTDPGATATDPTEGDISAEIIKVSDLDETNTGIYTITYSVTDASGNEAPSLTRVIYVVADKTPPELTLTGADTIDVEVFDPFDDPGATAFDLKAGNLTSAILVTGTVNTSVLGEYLVTYTVADDQSNTTVKTRLVRVLDTKVPVIDPKGTDNVQIGSAFFDQTTVTDNYDLDIMSKLQKTGTPVNPQVPGIYTITYNATDQSGNQAVPVIRNYRVDDFTLPVIDLKTTDTIIIDVNPNTPYKSVEPAVSDAYYTSDVITLTKVSSVNAYQLGTYTEVYTATDPSGNTSTRTRFVKVVDREAPELYANSLTIKVNSNYNPMTGIVVKDNYYGPAFLLPLVKVISYNVNIYEPGTYTIIYQVTDPSGNVSDPFARVVVVSEDADAMGTKDVAGNSFTVYPNPATDKVNISFKQAPGKNASISVYDITGKVVYESTSLQIINNQITIDLNGLSAGVYYVKLMDNASQTVEKLNILK